MRAVVHQQDTAHLVEALAAAFLTAAGASAGRGLSLSSTFLLTPVLIKSFTERYGRIRTMRLAISLLMPGSLAISDSGAVLRSTPVRVMATGLSGCAGAT